MPSPRRVKAHILIKRFDGDVGKENQLRGLLKARTMVRRDSNGFETVRNVIDGDKGTPPVER